MPTRNLKRIFAPKSVAIIGASRRAGSVGNTAARNLKNGGFAGQLFAVNRNYPSVEEIPCFPDLASIGQAVDLAVLCTPAESTPDLVEQCGQNGVRGIVILSAGFRETGQAGRELEGKLRDVLKRYPTMRIIGPNSLGVISTHNGLNASFADVSPPKGKIALLSQSGALATAILDWALDEQFGFSHFISFGNLLDVSIADLIDYLAEDPNTDSIVMYIESIQDSRAFMSAARAFARSKPIIALKSGRFETTAKAAALHTGAMVGVDEVYDAAFARAGVVRVDEFDDLIHCAELLARHNSFNFRGPLGNRLAVVTNAGGPGLMTADAILQKKCQLAELKSQTIEQLQTQIPNEDAEHSLVITNPVDLFGDATPELYESATRSLLADSNVDAVVVVLTPQAKTDPLGVAERIIKIASKSTKPILAVWMGRGSVAASNQRLSRAGIPTYSTPQRAIRAFSYLLTHARNQEVLHETPRSIAIDFQRDRKMLRESFASLCLSDSNNLTESNSKALLEAYEIRTTRPIATRSADEAIKYARSIGYPVAVKILASDVLHKSEVGGVILNVGSDEDVRVAYQTIKDRFAECRPDMKFQGVTVQPMAIDPNGRELIVGARRDPVFGTVMMVGAGGVQTQVLRDHALELPPLNERLARRMLESLQCWPMLKTFRGKPAVNLDELVQVLMRFSYLLADHPEILELDVNPLLVTPERVVALDASIVIDLDPDNANLKSGPAFHSKQSQYPHLAICPYPEQYTRVVPLSNSTEVTLRPIQPEDEPQWRAMLLECSEETIRMRFRYLLQGSNHELASRFCYTDYDRELAIIAELPLDSKSEQRPIAGVGRLVADADHLVAEFAVLVADQYQGLRLGSILIDECLAICQQWGIERVTAEVDPRNRKMLQMFIKRGFSVDRSDEDDLLVSKTLHPTEDQASSIDSK
ncbi:bifunctional acetate--CoA ligase family protein/GNAT family N-acetyltransferase [Neorhodopirellula lusitana]|uniref:bifunctional acetate--CoA ligase family protein/GNAT family N-acetyltransferase n=1 Tax=Neorhodopirellula lusitana TaxID=445327 RepID=UPI00384FEFD9